MKARDIKISLNVLIFIFLLLNKILFSQVIGEQKIETNKEILIEVLRGAGLEFSDAIKATEAFKRAYPLERLNKKSYLIMPPLGKEINVFAVNVDGLEAVLITRSKDKFISHITSLSKAKKIISEDTAGLSNIDNILPLTENKQLEKETIGGFIEKELVFEKGTTLYELLYANLNKKKEIRDAVREFKKIFEPSKIKVGTRGKIFKTKNKKLLAFYIVINKNRVAAVTDSPTGYKAKIFRKDNFSRNIKKSLGKEFQYFPKLNNTRISLFNATNLKKNEIKVKKGSNLSLILRNANISETDIQKILSKMKGFYNPKKIQVGQKLKIIFKDNKLYGFSIKLDSIKELQLVKIRDDFKIYLYKIPLRTSLKYSKISIQKNLFLDSEKEDLPIEVLIDMVRLFSYSIDFQRDIKPGAIFEVLYEKFYDYKNEFIKSGDIIYSKAILKKKNIEMFKFKLSENEYDYFDSNGKSIRKKLMRTPIDGARISSGFGNRRHPILGYTRLHKGVDFAARIGTPIYAAGDGRVERANRYGGYGKYIRIRHNSKYKTAYAHLNQFAKGIKKGKYVKQGDVIGFVGISGRSTGPHLHYEIIVNNKQVNPYKLKLPDGKKLDQEDFKNFEKEKNKILSKIKKINDE